MKRSGTMAGKGRVLALALTWDGARWPVRALPPKARAFLKSKVPGVSIPSRSETAKLFAHQQVREIRICWVPRLKGGDDVLSEPFAILTEKRISFPSIKTVRFGDVLGVVYRKR